MERKHFRTPAQWLSSTLAAMKNIILSQKSRIFAQAVLKYFLARGPDTAYIEALLS